MKTELKQLTASYEMTNTITGAKQWYYVIRKKAGFTREQIYQKFLADIKGFPAYQNNVMYVSSDIIITDYRGYQIEEIKVKL